MGINATLKRMCKQTAVYWASPVNNGTGGFTHDDPVEIKVRWEDKNEIVMDSKGQEFTSQAEVFVRQDVDELGYLFLGSLDDLDSDEEDNPISIDRAYQIKKFHKIPDTKGREFMRKVWL